MIVKKRRLLEVRMPVSEKMTIMHDVRLRDSEEILLFFTHLERGPFHTRHRHRKSSFPRRCYKKNIFPPFSVARDSETVGIGYSESFISGFTVSL